MKAVNNRRGESITHLMQFSLPPRPQYDPRRNHYSRFAPQRHTWGVGSGHHAVDKARYVMHVLIADRVSILTEDQVCQCQLPFCSRS